MQGQGQGHAGSGPGKKATVMQGHRVIVHGLYTGPGVQSQGKGLG